MPTAARRHPATKARFRFRFGFGFGLAAEEKQKEKKAMRSCIIEQLWVRRTHMWVADPYLCKLKKYPFNTFSLFQKGVAGYC